MSAVDVASSARVAMTTISTAVAATKAAFTTKSAKKTGCHVPMCPRAA